MLSLAAGDSTINEFRLLKANFVLYKWTLGAITAKNAKENQGHFDNSN